MLAAALYIVNVVICNWLFHLMPSVDLGSPLGVIELGTVLIGFTFVFRDYAQRAIGHWVLPCMLLATILSFAMADPFVAVASALAFASSEVVDWLLYTATKRPFHKRVFISSLASTPVDSVVFLWWLESLSLGSLIVMFIAKMLAAIAVVIYYETRGETKAYQY